ncbi:MAG: sugar ABC transporter permease [Firmicutes bacterium]|nr:sugar ABC transporter permease [Bacillota bacterium]
MVVNRGLDAPEVSLKRSRRSAHAWGIAYLMIGPGFFLMLLWIYGPAIYNFVLSLQNFQPGTPHVFVGLANYVQLFTSGGFWDALARTTEYLLIVPVMVILPLSMALLVNQKLPGMSIYRVIFFIPGMMSMVVVSILFSEIFQTQGLLNDVLVSLHITSTYISWLAIPKLTILFIMIVTVWAGQGQAMMFFLAALQAVEPELYDAAKVDGAGFIRRVISVTIPGISLYLIYIIIGATTSALNIFTEIQIITTGGPLSATTTLSYYIYQQAFVNGNFGYAAALQEVHWLLMLVFTLVQFFYLGRKWVANS